MTDNNLQWADPNPAGNLLVACILIGTGALFAGLVPSACLPLLMVNSIVIGVVLFVTDLALPIRNNLANTSGWFFILCGIISMFYIELANFVKRLHLCSNTIRSGENNDCQL
jgi:hypothetical protein